MQTPLVLEIKTIGNHDEIKFIAFYLKSKVETIINGSDNDYIFESIYTAIISNIKKTLEKVLVGLLIQL